jgi:Tol biopolymer transport system component
MTASMAGGLVHRVLLFAVAASVTALSGCSSSASTSVPSSAHATPVTAKLVVQVPTGNGIYGIFLVDGSGKVGAKLSEGVTSARHPDWSPDGMTVAFDSDDDGSLRLVQADGSNPRPLLSCDPGCFALAHPAFSPDGKSVAYVRYEPTTGTDPNNSPPKASSIRVLNLSTMISTVLASARQPELVDVPRWSPDGARLVYAVDVFDRDLNETGSTIAIVASTGGASTRLLPISSWAYAPDWNRSTGEILYSNEEKDYAARDYRGEAWDLWGISPDGGTPRRLTHLKAGQHLVYPTWSPDGRVVLASFDDSGDRVAVSVDTVTGAMTKLVAGTSVHARLKPNST